MTQTHSLPGPDPTIAGRWTQSPSTGRWWCCLAAEAIPRSPVPPGSRGENSWHVSSGRCGIVARDPRRVFVRREHIDPFGLSLLRGVADPRDLFASGDSPPRAACAGTPGRTARTATQRPGALGDLPPATRRGPTPSSARRARNALLLSWPQVRKVLRPMPVRVAADDLGQRVAFRPREAPGLEEVGFVAAWIAARSSTQAEASPARTSAAVRPRFSSKTRALRASRSNGPSVGYGSRPSRSAPMTWVQ